MQFDTRRMILLAAYVAACVISFAPGLPGPFLLDDLTNLPLAAPIDGNLDALWDASLSNSSGLLRRPLANLSFALNYLVTGPSAWHFKLVNLVLHVAAGIALFFLARAMAGTVMQKSHATFCAWVAMTLWAVHPAQVGVVLYVVQRMSILSGLFVLIACAIYAQWRTNPAMRERVSPLRISALLGTLGVAGLLCKENAALLPLLLGCIELYIRSTGPRPAVPDRHMRFVLTSCVIIPVAVMPVVVLLSWDSIAASYAGRDFTLAERLSTQIHALADYLEQAVLPTPGRFAFFHDAYPVHYWNETGTLLMLVAGIGLLGLLLRYRRTVPGLAFGAVWFLCAHAMESSLLPLELFWEHRNYIPLAGLLSGAIIDVGSALSRLTADHRPWPAATVATVVLVAVATLCIQRSAEFGSPVTIAQRTTSTYPDSVRGNLLGLEAYLRYSPDPQPSEVAVWLDRLAGIPASAAGADYLGFLLSCSGHRFDKQLHQAIDNAKSIAYDGLVLGFAGKIAGTVAGGGCESLEAEATALIDDLLANSHYTHPDTRAALLLARANLAGKQADMAKRIALLSEASKLDPTNPTPVIELVQHHLYTGNVEAASASLSELRAGQARYGKPIRAIIRGLELQLASARPPIGS